MAPIMVDLWTASEGGTHQPSGSIEDDPRVRALVHQTLMRELTRRKGMRAHAQLGVRLDADAGAIDDAWLALRARYEPNAYQRYGVAIVAMARQIVALLDEARTHMRDASAQPAATPRRGLVARLFGGHKR
jgi:hypothetical protein